MIRVVHFILIHPVHLKVIRAVHLMCCNQDMAGNIIDMSKIKQLLQLKKSGLSNRQIVKDLRISRDKQ